MIVCFHAGEHRRVLLPGVTSVGITATDALGVLQWRCDDASGDAIVYATGLREDRGLRDLVDAAGRKPNSVRVTFRNGESRMTEPGTWWPNLVLPLPANGSVRGVAMFGS